MKYEFNIEHNTIFIIKLKRWVINNSMCNLCFCVIVHVLSTIVINLFSYSGCYDILNTDEQLEMRYILYSKTFAPQCEVKIIVFIVLLLDANFATFLFYFIIMLSLYLFLLCLCLCFVIILFSIIMLSLFLFLLLFCLVHVKPLFYM
jgi:hypothetical protein